MSTLKRANAVLSSTTFEHVSKSGAKKGLSSTTFEHVSKSGAGFTLILRRTRDKRGFTLIEMLIVVAIIGLLSSVILVGLGDVRKEARDTRRISDIRQMQNQLEIYYSEHQSYPPDVYEQLQGTPFDPVADPTTGELHKYVYERLSQNSYLLGTCLEGARPTGISHISQNFRNDITNYGVGCNCDEAAQQAYCVKS
ncbi:MAG: type II secretion system protein [Candidatus Jorgensenbacteria bacterium]